MKREAIFLILVFASFQLAFGQSEVRRPFVEISVNGKMYKNGDQITVQKGQVLNIKASQKGGRRDFVNYPDAYLKITPDIQVLSRGNDQLIYSDKNVKMEWKLLKENAAFSSDDHLTLKSNTTVPNEAEVRIGVGDFSRTYLKIDLHTTWQFSSGEEQKLERNTSNALIYFNVAGATSTWYVSKNIHALGTKDQGIADILNSIQGNIDTIEFHLTHLNYAEVQKDIRNLQIGFNSLNSRMQQARASNPAFNTEVHFTGLPSDRPIADLGVFDKLQLEWNRLGTFLFEQTSVINSGDDESLKNSIQKYLDWQFNLPDNWLIVMGLYLPGIKSADIVVPAKLQAVVEGKQPSDPGSIEQFKDFLSQRAQNVESEKQQIAQTKNKLQAVKLFDGMLRSYFSSLNWIEWENIRESGFALAK